MTEDTARWIWIPNWDDFQHYRDRRPTWIKAYVELLDHDEYRPLNLRQRGLLHGLWLLTARRGNGRIAASYPSLSSLLALKDHGDKTYLSRDLERLSHAGLVDIRASKGEKPRYQSASAEGLLRKPIRAAAQTASADALASKNGEMLHPLHPPGPEARDSDGFLI